MTSSSISFSYDLLLLKLAALSFYPYLVSIHSRLSSLYPILFHYVLIYIKIFVYDLIYFRGYIKAPKCMHRLSNQTIWCNTSFVRLIEIYHRFVIWEKIHWDLMLVMKMIMLHNSLIGDFWRLSLVKGLDHYLFNL